MIFRPKIFISSTFKENEKLRRDIKTYFDSVGAEALLYEINLTPDIKPLSYRTNILEADFIILIAKKNYGTKTETGLSGIHEEYLIAKNRKIPMHVYIDSKESKQKRNKLINDLKKDGVSYYLFDDDKQLLKKLKETTFTIAKEIMFSKIANYDIPSETIYKLAGNSDYNKGIRVIKIIESMNSCIANYEWNYVDYSLFFDCLEAIISEFKNKPYYFINWETNKLIGEFIAAAQEFNSYFATHNTSGRIIRKVSIDILGEIDVTNERTGPYNVPDDEEYKRMIKSIFKKYENFKKHLQELHTATDLING